MMALNIWDMIKFGQKKKLYELYDEELLVSGKSPK
jgi:molybdenum cofactor biosynthesis enzyme